MTQDRLEQLKTIFSTLLPDSLVMSHYDLSEKFTQVTVAEWKDFLTEPEIETWISSELALLQNSQLNKIIADLSKNSNSVGRAQVINSLVKMQEGNTNKGGPVFIYTFVPLDEREKESPVVATPLDINIFEK